MLMDYLDYVTKYLAWSQSPTKARNDDNLPIYLAKTRLPSRGAGSRSRNLAYRVGLTIRPPLRPKLLAHTVADKAPTSPPATGS
eukprot:6199293-Pleurochrysis_carterae.AAC.1